MSISGVASYPVDCSLSVNAVNKNELAVNQLSNNLGIKPGGMYSVLMNSLVNALSAAGVNVDPAITNSAQVSTSSTSANSSTIIGSSTVSGSSSVSGTNSVTGSSSVSTSHQQANNAIEPSLAEAIAQFLYALMYSLQCMSEQVNAAAASTSGTNSSSSVSPSGTVSSVSATSATMVAASGNSAQSDLAALLNQLGGGMGSSDNSNNSSSSNSHNNADTSGSTSVAIAANSNTVTTLLSGNSELQGAIVASNMTPSANNSVSTSNANNGIKGLQRAYSNLMTNMGVSSSRVPLTLLLKNFSAQLATQGHGEIVDTTS